MQGCTRTRIRRPRNAMQTEVEDVGGAPDCHAESPHVGAGPNAPAHGLRVRELVPRGVRVEFIARYCVASSVRCTDRVLAWSRVLGRRLETDEESSRSVTEHYVGC